jgi:hypothetical protein
MTPFSQWDKPHVVSVILLCFLGLLNLSFDFSPPGPPGTPGQLKPPFVLRIAMGFPTSVGYNDPPEQGPTFCTFCPPCNGFDSAELLDPLFANLLS